MKAEDCFDSMSITDNQNNEKDLGQEGRLNSKMETTKAQHIY